MYHWGIPYITFKKLLSDKPTCFFSAWSFPQKQWKSQIPQKYWFFSQIKRSPFVYFDLSFQIRNIPAKFGVRGNMLNMSNN